MRSRMHQIAHEGPGEILVVLKRGGPQLVIRKVEGVSHRLDVLAHVGGVIGPLEHFPRNTKRDFGPLGCGFLEARSLEIEHHRVVVEPGVERALPEVEKKAILHWTPKEDLRRSNLKAGLEAEVVIENAQRHDRHAKAGLVGREAGPEYPALYDQGCDHVVDP